MCSQPIGMVCVLCTRILRILPPLHARGARLSRVNLLSLLLPFARRSCARRGSIILTRSIVRMQRRSSLPLARTGASATQPMHRTVRFAALAYLRLKRVSLCLRWLSQSAQIVKRMGGIFKMRVHSAHQSWIEAIKKLADRFPI